MPCCSTTTRTTCRRREESCTRSSSDRGRTCAQYVPKLLHASAVHATILASHRVLITLRLHSPTIIIQSPTRAVIVFHMIQCKFAPSMLQMNSHPRGHIAHTQANNRQSVSHRTSWRGRKPKSTANTNIVVVSAIFHIECVYCSVHVTPI